MNTFLQNVKMTIKGTHCHIKIKILFNLTNLQLEAVLFDTSSCLKLSSLMLCSWKKSRRSKRQKLQQREARDQEGKEDDMIKTLVNIRIDNWKNELKNKSEFIINKRQSFPLLPTLFSSLVNKLQVRNGTFQYLNTRIDWFCYWFHHHNIRK